MKRILLFILTIGVLLCHDVFAQQTTGTVSVSGAGWKRVASIQGSGGRSFGRITLYTEGGDRSPYMSNVSWYHDWVSYAGISVSSDSDLSPYWSEFRITDDGTNAYVEVNFTANITSLKLLLDDYNWRPATLYTGVAPDGGGNVSATAKNGRINIGDKFIVQHSGKVGIGTINPTSQLDILSPAIAGGEKLMKFQVSDASNDYLEIVNSTGVNSVFVPALRGAVSSPNITALYLIGEITAANDIGSNPITVFDSRLNNIKANTRPLFGWDSYGTRQMILLANGNLGIGTNNPREKLSVNGKIRAREIKVETANWPDYVFAKDYQLPTLQETEQHIKDKGHLPGIPSAEEVKNNGFDLGDMNAKLLQKIEELTLHLIEQNKKVNRLEEIIRKNKLQ